VEAAGGEAQGRQEKEGPVSTPKRELVTPSEAEGVHFFEAFGRMLAFLEDPGPATRRQFYGLLLREVLHSAGCEQGSLLLAWPPGQVDELRLEAVQGLASEVWAGEQAGAPDSAAGRAVRTAKPVSDSGAFGPLLALPLIYREEALGALLLAQDKAFSPQQQAAAKATASGLAAVLKAFQSLSLKRQAEQRLTAIVNAGTAVQRGRDLEAVLDRIIREAEALLDAEGASVFLLDDNDGSLRAPVATGLGGERLRDLRLKKGEGIVGWVAEHGEAQLVEDVQNDPRFAKQVDKATRTATRSLVAVPILVDEGRVLGVLEVLNKRSGGRFHPGELPVLQALALLAGVAIENARLMEGLTERARRLNAEVLQANVETTEAKNRLESVLFAMEDAVLSADENGLVNLCNRAAQFLTFGLLRRDVTGLPLTEALPHPAVAEGLLQVREALTPLTVEIELGAADERRSYAVVLTPIKDLEGYLTGFVTVMRDITRFRELERMKTAFLNTVSHELRTPITSIRAFSELMAKRQADPEKSREWSAVINEEAERLNRLVDDLLDVSRIESGKKLSVIKRPVELKPLIDRTLTLFGKDAATHPIHLSMDEGLTLAELDADRIEQVLSNLLSNAIKYSPAGGAVELRVRFSPPEGMRIEVQDHGLGLKPDDQANIFQKFYRVEGAHMNGIRGTGLGLSITKYLVEAHGGRMGVESVFGQGSQFWFEVPLFGPQATA
jgi:two-component system phosphate regulon sensor histidine kinase PhoR